MTLLARIVLSLLALLALCGVSACSFDDSALDEKTGCESDDDCLSGACIQRTCVEPGSIADAGDSFDVGIDVMADAADDSESTDTGCPGDENSCGGCSSLAGSPGASCGGACGVWVCQSAESVVCEEEPENSCGGCSALDGRPGAPCGSGCGVFQCSGMDSVTCVDVAANSCGGCAELAAEPGTSCGACPGGTWQCSGRDDVVCNGGEVNTCGGCGGEPSAIEGAVCRCDRELTTPAVWTCADPDQPSCEDGNDDPDNAYFVGSYTDSITETLVIEDALQTEGDVDWYELEVIDIASTEELVPAATVVGAQNDDVLCLFWVYKQPRSWTLSCGDDSSPATYNGVDGCCSNDSVSSRKTVSVRQLVGFPQRLDSNPGEGNDDGNLFILVFNDSDSATCADYQLQIQL